MLFPKPPYCPTFGINYIHLQSIHLHWFTLPAACSLLLSKEKGERFFPFLGKGDGRELTWNQIMWSNRPCSPPRPQLKCFSNVSWSGCWTTADLFTALFKSKYFNFFPLLLCLPVHAQLFEHTAQEEANGMLIIDVMLCNYHNFLRILGTAKIRT